jgi:hypothetical protein
MSKKCISIMVLSAFLHYLMAGCVKTTMVQQEKLSVESTECCVYAVILTTGENYEFEKPGGRYNVVPHLLTGTLNDGRKFFLDLADENIKEIRISTGQTISSVDLAKNPDQTISEIMVDGNIYTFDQNDGVIPASLHELNLKRCYDRLSNNPKKDNRWRRKNTQPPSPVSAKSKSNSKLGVKPEKVPGRYPRNFGWLL